MTRTTKPPKAAATKFRAAPQQPVPPYGTPEWVAYRKAAIARTSFFMDYGDPTAAVGHAYGVRQSSRLTRDYRQIHRKLAMDITPQPVIEVLIKAGVKKWVLMGLHGYVGYMAMPRATQDVDILIAMREKKKAVDAIKAAWPTLLVEEFPVVIRFRDPNDLGADGQPKPTIDLMLPYHDYQKTILKSYVIRDEETQHAIPRIEAALVAKYAAMMSDERARDKKEQDSSDFRRITRPNMSRIDIPKLRFLAEEFWVGAGDDIVRFLDLAVRDEAFPI